MITAPKTAIKYTNNTVIFAIFTQIKQNKMPLEDLTSLEQYYFIKAFKLVAYTDFIKWCKEHKIDSITNQPKALFYILHNILNKNYPPLVYNHNEINGYTELDCYVNLAKMIF